jgi:hypothetical protein
MSLRQQRMKAFTVMPVMESRQPGSHGCSGDVHVDLDSSSPCWNNVSGVPLLKTEAGLSVTVFSKEHLKE